MLNCLFYYFSFPLQSALYFFVFCFAVEKVDINFTVIDKLQVTCNLAVSNFQGGVTGGPEQVMG